MRGNSWETARAGVTLLEVLLATAIAGTLATGAVFAASGVREKVRAHKLAQDAETVNRAVRVFEGMGGDLTGVPPHPYYVLGVLKTTDENVDEATGLTGNAIDARLQADLMLTADELNSDAPRAVWNVTERRFEIVNDNSVTGAKVRQFVLLEDEAVDALVADFFGDFIRPRNRAFHYASTGTWVWDYIDNPEGAAPAPTAVGLSPDVPTTPPPGPGGPPILDPPTFSIAGGSHPLANYPAALTLANPNDPAVSQVYYWTSGTGWQLYGGTPITLMPGDSVSALTVSTDEDDWTSSGLVSNTYAAAPVTLEVEVLGPAAVNWGEAGGGLQPGGPAPAPAAPAQIGIANAAAIPNLFESSAVFTVFWTTDGSDPRTSGTRQQAGAFAGGFPGQSQDVDLAVFGVGASLEIQAFASSLDTSVLSSSGVASHTVAIDKTVLRNPAISDTAAVVTIDLDTSFGDMPVGARVFYTLDDTDPVEAAGLPVTGFEYTGPFSVKGNGMVNVTVRARVFGPAGYEHWFTPSETVGSVVTVPPPVMSFWQTVELETP